MFCHYSTPSSLPGGSASDTRVPGPAGSWCRRLCGVTSPGHALILVMGSPIQLSSSPTQLRVPQWDFVAPGRVVRAGASQNAGTFGGEVQVVGEGVPVRDLGSAVRACDAAGMGHVASYRTLSLRAFAPVSVFGHKGLPLVSHIPNFQLCCSEHCPIDTCFMWLWRENSREEELIDSVVLSRW